MVNGPLVDYLLVSVIVIQPVKIVTPIKSTRNTRPTNGCPGMGLVQIIRLPHGATHSVPHVCGISNKILEKHIPLELGGLEIER